MERIINQIGNKDKATADRMTHNAIGRLESLCNFSKRSLRRMLFGSPRVKKERYNPDLSTEYLKEAFPVVTTHLERILLDLGGYQAINFGNAVAVGSRGQRVRLGRALIKAVKSLYYNVLQLDALHAAVVGEVVEVDNFNKVKIAERIVQRLGTIFSSKHGDIYITTDALDFLTAGIVSGAKSCYRPGGIHFGGCSAYAMDEQTLLVQYIREGELIGRFWVHVDFENLLVLAEPIYGTFPEAFQKQVLEYITEKLRTFMSHFENIEGLPFGELDTYYVAMELRSDFPENQYPGYIDFLAGKYSDCRAYGVTVDRYSRQVFELQLREGLCLECGNIGCTGDGFCKKCNEPVFCARCGRLLYEYETFYLDEDDDDVEPLCYDCYRELSDTRSSPK